MSIEDVNKNNLENSEVLKTSQENAEQKEISQEEFLNWLDNEGNLFKQETQIELAKANSVDLDQPTFEKIKDETNFENDLNSLDQEVTELVLQEKQRVAKESNYESEISKEFINSIIEKENLRYKSEEALSRARKIDTDFPPSSIETLFNKHKSQEKNIDYIGHDPVISIGDWLNEGMGGYYRKQPALVSRKKDFIEVTSKANPNQISQILRHEYNHMFTQGNGNFSAKYKKYIRDIFFNDEKLKKMGQDENNKILLHVPYPDSGPVYKYLTTPEEINAYLGTNLRSDLLRSGIIKDFYQEIDESVLEQALSIKDSNCNRSETPIYKIYSTIIKDKKRLVEWLNVYAI